MQAYLLNAAKRSIQSYIYEGDYQNIVKLLGPDVRFFTVVNLYGRGATYSKRIDAFIDDEGLYADNQFFWMHTNYPVPLAGNALILGTTRDGDACDANIDIETLRDDVKFIGDKFQLQMMMAFARAENLASSPAYSEDYREFVWKHH